MFAFFLFLTLTLGGYPTDAVERLGIGFGAQEPGTNQRYPYDSLSRYDLAALYGDSPSGWYYDWGFRLDGAWERGTLDYAVQMLWSVPHTETLRALTANNPGDVFVVGNEPDVRGQSNMTPTRYAEFYHLAYKRIKFVCPDCQVAIAGVLSASPLRLAYLDRVWAEHERLFSSTMTVDVYTVHGFTLCEKCGHVPSGMTDLLHLADADLVAGASALEMMQRRIVAMRAWMASRCESDKPLWVTEFGILGGVEAVGIAEFMRQSIAWLLTVQDDLVGMAGDERRLVQRMAWFSVNSNSFSGALFDKMTGEALPLASVFAEVRLTLDGEAQRAEVVEDVRFVYLPIVGR